MVNPVCLLTATLGGLLNVLARLALAYPDAQQKKHDKEYSPCFMRGMLVFNLLLQVLSSGANVVAGLLGPVSIVLPTIVTSQMVFNMLFFGVLRLEAFEKTKRVGTFVIMASTILLETVGPDEQPDQDILHLLSEPYALVWSCLLGLICLVATIQVWRRCNGLFGWLLASQVTATVIATTAAKMFNLVSGGALGAAVVVWALTGIVLLYTVVVQSTEVSQAQFVPALVAGNIGINALMGVIVWEDWRVVRNWVGYVFVFFQLGMGCYLLTQFDLLTRFQRTVLEENPDHSHPVYASEAQTRSFQVTDIEKGVGNSSRTKEDEEESEEAGHVGTEEDKDEDEDEVKASVLSI